MQCTLCHKSIDDEAAFCPWCKTSVVDGPRYDTYDYEAFISYRHLPRDRKVAVRLQRRLEGMRIPKGVTSYDGRHRLGKLFRDEDELPTASSLSDQIKDALKHSRRLIVICSPKTSESRWVQREVELYASYHGRDSIRLVLAEGEPDESFPALMRTSLKLDAKTGELCEVEEEPIAADLRSDARRQFDAESLRIAAALIGCGYDDLRQRLHARRMRLTAIATSAIALVSTAFGSFSIWQQRQIERNYQRALANESQSLAVDSAELLAHGDRLQAIQVALAALPQSDVARDRPLVPAAQLALEEALEVYPSFNIWRSRYSIGEVTETYAWSQGGLQAIIDKRNRILVSNIETGEQLACIDIPRAETVDALDQYAYEASSFRDSIFCGETLIVGWTDGIAAFSPTTGERMWSLSVEGYGPLGTLAHSNDGKMLAACARKIEYDADSETFSYYVQATVIDASDGTVLHQCESEPIRLDDSFASSFCACQASFSPDGKTLVTAYGGRLTAFDLTKDKKQEVPLSNLYATDLLFSPDGIVSLSTDGVYSVTTMDPLVSIDVFEEDLSTRWSASEEPVFSLDNHGSYDTPTIQIADTFSDDRGGSSLAIAIGRDAIVYRMADGTVANRYSMESAVATCAVSSGSHRLFIVTQDGSVVIKLPDVDQSEHYTSYWSQNIGATDAATVLIANKSAYLVAYDATNSSHRVFRYSPPSLETIPGLEELDNFSESTDWTWSKDTPLVGFTETMAEAFDATTFERLWQIQIDDLKELEPFSGYSTVCLTDEALYLFDALRSDKSPVVRCSTQTGEILDTIDVKPEANYENMKSIQHFAVDGRDLLLVQYVYEVAIVDLATKETVCRIRCTQEDETSIEANLEALVYQDTWEIDEGLVFGSSVFLLEKRATERRVELFSLQDGAPLEGDVTGFAPSPTAVSGQSWVCDAEGTRLALLCSDGMLRLFDTTSWKPLWESASVPATAQRVLDFSSDASTLVIQDLSGTLMLVSTADGSILASSTTTLPPITSCTPLDESSLLAMYRYPSSSPELNHHGLAVISLDADAFGPKSDYPYGFFWSSDAKRILARGGSVYETFPYYTLDELIDLAHETVLGHELTDAERHLYRIAS